MTDLQTTTSIEAAEAEISALLGQLKGKVRDFKAAFGHAPLSLYDGPRAIPKPELLNGCEVLQDRTDILRRIPAGGRFAEVGTLYGDFAVTILDIVRPSELHLFDLSFRLVRPEHGLKIQSAGVHMHKGESWETLGAVPAASFDVVYVDADHSHEAVTKDLAAALRAVKPGGYIICNDYTGWSQPQCIPYGVFGAVNQFANRHNLPFRYLALQINGFYDVALQNCEP